MNIPRSVNSSTTQNKGKTPMPIPSYKRSHGGIGHNILSNYGSFVNNGSKGAFGSKVSWGHPKDAKSNFKGPSKSRISDKKSKLNTLALSRCLRITTRGIRPRISSLPTTNTTNVAGQILRLTVLWSDTFFLIVLSRSLERLRVL